LTPKQKEMFQELKWRAVGFLGKTFIDLLFRTTTVETRGFELVNDIVNSNRYIFAFWHSRILLLSYIYKGINAVILVSPSKDGEIIARIVQCQGHFTIRGSSSRGGLRALAKQIKCLNAENRPGVVIPDGPRGPRFKVQPGVIMLSKKTGCPIVPMTYSAKKLKIFASWDRFLLPYPFTRCLVIYGNPVRVPSDADEQEREKKRAVLEKELQKITKTADAYFGHLIE
jgi:lysophospholipid acyltransferase (LPLAT)-like uncharacterized protein